MGVAYFLGLVPRLELAEVVIGAGRQLELEIEAEEAVDMLHEVEQLRNLLFDLFSDQLSLSLHVLMRRTCEGKQNICVSS